MLFFNISNIRAVACSEHLIETKNQRCKKFNKLYNIKRSNLFPLSLHCIHTSILTFSDPSFSVQQIHYFSSVISWHPIAFIFNLLFLIKISSPLIFKLEFLFYNIFDFVSFVICFLLSIKLIYLKFGSILICTKGI